MERPRTLQEVGGVTAAILAGEHDAELQYIHQACGARLKRMFRKGQRVRLVGTRNVELDLKVGTIEKVNTKTISVEIPEVGIYNVSPNLLELVVA
jgi:hypothetical protein